MSNVRETHWAKCDRESWEKFQAFIPKALETHFDLWQTRVDRKSKTPHLPHVHVFCVTAREYETGADGWTRAKEPERTLHFLVVAENSHEAYQRAEAELKAHGLEQKAPAWSYGIEFSTILILNGTK